MTPAEHRAALRRAERTGEWEMAERATRAFAFRWLCRAARRFWRRHRSGRSRP